MPPALSAKFAGLPRWAWLAILAGGLTVGLILRSRQEEPEEETLEEDIETAPDAGMLGDPTYEDYPGYEYEDGSGGVVYPPPNLPPAVPSPNIDIDVNVGGKGGGGCGKKPKRDAKKGKRWACKNGKWAQVDKNRAGKDGKNSRDRGPLTGGGPPSRRSSHRPALNTQADKAKTVLRNRGPVKTPVPKKGKSKQGRRNPGKRGTMKVRGS